MSHKCNYHSGCVFTVPTNCVIYTGPYLPNYGIYSNTTLSEVLKKIDENKSSAESSDIKTGSYTFSGNGLSLFYDIPHGLMGTPSYIDVQPASPDARGISYIQALNNGTTDVIRVFYDVSPVPGISNGILKWEAKL
jgi:hypothetical protein